MRKLGFKTSRGRSTLLSDFLFECTKTNKQNKTNKFFSSCLFQNIFNDNYLSWVDIRIQKT